MTTDVLIVIGSLGTLFILTVTLLWNWYLSRPRIGVSPFEVRSCDEFPDEIDLSGRLVLESKTSVSTSLVAYSIQMQEPQPLSTGALTGGSQKQGTWSWDLICGAASIGCPLAVPGGQATALHLTLRFHESARESGRPVRGRLILEFMHGQRRTVRIEAHPERVQL